MRHGERTASSGLSIALFATALEEALLHGLFLLTVSEFDRHPRGAHDVLRDHRDRWREVRMPAPLSRELVGDAVARQPLSDREEIRLHLCVRRQLKIAIEEHRSKPLVCLSLARRGPGLEVEHQPLLPRNLGQRVSSVLVAVEPAELVGSEESRESRETPRLD